MSVHELKQPVRVVKAADVPKRPEPPSRSENTLLWELIQRDPERAKAFLERLGYAVRQAA